MYRGYTGYYERPANTSFQSFRSRDMTMKNKKTAL